jgi:ABC-type multidrug transport system ATPase subunit
MWAASKGDSEDTGGKAKVEKEKSAKSMRAVDGLTCKFARGQITAVLGHNGAGKSTTIRCITGGLTPTSGTIIVNGKDAKTNAAWLRANVGVCPQHDVLYDELTAREHILLFGALKGDVDVDKVFHSCY